MATRESDGQELAAQVGDSLDACGDQLILLLRIASMSAVVAILTVGDEDDNQFLSVWIAAQQILDLHEDIHEDGSTTSTNLLDAICVALQCAAFSREAIDVVVVDHCVELRERSLL